MIVYHASALICSGRPDPVWELKDGMAGQLLKVWDSLPPLFERIASSSHLGYRGCLLTASDGKQWSAVASTVFLKKNGLAEYRYDEKRIMEKLLLSSAPAFIIPKQIIMELLRDIDMNMQSMNK